jgi:hypothetical protein
MTAAARGADNRRRAASEKPPPHGEPMTVADDNCRTASE